MNRLNHALLFLFFLSLFGGCATVRHAREVQRRQSPLPGERPVSFAASGLTTGCTTSVERLEDIALAHRPAMLQASQEVAYAQANIRAVNAERWPQISANTSYRAATANAEGQKTSWKMHESWSGSIGLDLLLYDFGKTGARERQAAESLVAAEASLRETEIQTICDVRTAFFEVHRARHLLEVAADNLEQYRVHLDEAKTMLDVGSCRKYDVTKAEVDYGNARLELINASNDLINARAQLNAQVGFAESPVYELAETALPTRQINDNADTLMAFARENAPALAVLRARERAASNRVDEAIADLYPSLSVGASFDLSGRSFPLVPNASGFGRIIYDFFTGFRRTAVIDEAVSQLLSARAAVATEEQSLYAALVQAANRRDSARERTRVTRETLKQAQENFEIVDEQFRVGSSSSIERTDAQVQVTQARADAVRVYYDEQIAQAEIASLMGLAKEPR